MGAVKVDWDRVFDHPERVAGELTAGDDLWGTEVVQKFSLVEQVVFTARFEPLPELANLAYGTEAAWVVADRRIKKMWAYPARGRDREWSHRYPGAVPSCLHEPLALRPQRLSRHDNGRLCLYYPDDPQAARWQWRDGPIEFIQMVQRHLWFEESARRTGEWPVEDAPHGAADEPHPIRTDEMRHAIEAAS